MLSEQYKLKQFERLPKSQNSVGLDRLTMINAAGALGGHLLPPPDVVPSKLANIAVHTTSGRLEWK